MTDRKCARCGDSWPLDAEFFSVDGDGFDSVCLACRSEEAPDVPCDAHRYTEQYAEGWRAAAGESCPYPMTMIGMRCAWLAGYRDRPRGVVA